MAGCEKVERGARSRCIGTVTLQERAADWCFPFCGLHLCSACMGVDVHLASMLAHWSAECHVRRESRLQSKGGSLAADILTLDQPCSAMAQQLMRSGTQSMLDGCFDLLARTGGVRVIGRLRRGDAGCEIAMHRHSYKSVTLTDWCSSFCGLPLCFAWVRTYALGVDVGTLIGLQKAKFTGDAFFSVRAVLLPPIY